MRPPTENERENMDMLRVLFPKFYIYNSRVRGCGQTYRCCGHAISLAKCGANVIYVYTDGDQNHYISEIRELLNGFDECDVVLQQIPKIMIVRTPGERPGQIIFRKLDDHRVMYHRLKGMSKSETTVIVDDDREKQI